MQQLPGRRSLALAAALAFAMVGSAFAQDTTETGRAAIDTTEPAAGAIDTAGVDTAGVDTAGVDTSAVTDTSAARDTTDTSAVQNPPGYRGMERDTTLFPAEGGAPATPEEAAEQTTGVYKDSAAGDTSGAQQNPQGYRGMERPVEGDTTAGEDTTGAQEGDAYREERPAAADTAAGHEGHESGAGVGDTTTPAPDSAQ
jgi:hypothetical protein